VYALPSAPPRIDPLRAVSPSARTIAAQIYEPLVETLSGPYGDLRRRKGLAIRWTPSADRAVWRFRLRDRVRFEDGEPLNAGAVLENVDRWSGTAAGRSLLPGLVGADAPRPDLVRFVFGGAVPDLPRRLSDLRLGLVSPAGLRSGRTGAERTAGAGSGPFSLIHRGDARVELTRNPRWWGSQRGLGPALDGVQFTVTASSRQRAGLLGSGEAQAASGLDARSARTLLADPLLAAVRTPDGTWLGLERSVRGLSRTPEPFSRVWLTRIGQR
jgi:ABC-type transport system substrate-binding protein